MLKNILIKQCNYIDGYLCMTVGGVSDIHAAKIRVYKLVNEDISYELDTPPLTFSMLVLEK